MIDRATRESAQATVKRLDEYQSELGLSDAVMAEQFPDLGYASTWRVFYHAQDWQDNLTPQMVNHLRNCATILDGGTPGEAYYPDMPFAQAMAKRLGLLERQRSDRRILPCLAANGTGKSAFARWAVRESRATRALVRCRPTWRGSLRNIYSGIASAFGDLERHASARDAESAAIARCAGKARTIFVDQAHEGGLNLMHALRALVDETPLRVVYLGYATAFRRVLTGTSDGLVEARAFLGRCTVPLLEYQDGTSAADVKAYLQHEGVKANPAGILSSKITPVLKANTNLRLLEEALASARGGTDSPDLNPDTVYECARGIAGALGLSNRTQ